VWSFQWGRDSGLSWSGIVVLFHLSNQDVRRHCCSDQSLRLQRVGGFKTPARQRWECEQAPNSCSLDSQGLERQEASGGTHCADNSNLKPRITAEECIFVWNAILIFSCVYFGGKNNCGINNIYQNAPYGVSIPFIQNTMPRDAFDFMQRYIHFVNNRDRRKDGKPGYNPLFKVQPVLNTVMDGLRRAWIAGEKNTIYESMIKYCGRAVSYVQYMPNKPIKHGIKVFAVTACLLGFKIYTTCKTVDHGTVCCCQTSDYYRWVDFCLWAHLQLATMLYEYDKYGWRFCGTITSKEKLSHQDRDVPFAKLSKGGLNSVPRGWMREAGLQQKIYALAIHIVFSARHGRTESI
jgi:hypothetical protein